MNLPHYQKGLSMAGWMFLILVIGSVITIGTKLAPLYLDHNTMSNIMDGLPQEKGMVTKGNVELTDILRKRFKMNNIRDFDFKNHLTINRPEDRVVIDMNYEVRLPLVHNVDLIASFEKQIILRD
ncbi:MAG: DUF4845 domain-containing protein [Pseudomonadales bacterium]|jgi:hypothetical protein|nr:DUF4845 domain-containing protein [Pseudomonadales bacterium]HJN50096.1 DUF4845 domain-containing protein [Pseudomonadales bacterium]|tara:strand:- start:373 stop:747 length:375 start_codon:yes stop_codon:yes gene_type:complete